MVDITQAKKDTDDLYKYLNEIATDVVKKYTKTLDELVKSLSKNIDTCSNEEIRKYMAKISVEAYQLGINKEEIELKELCANALYKEKVAESFNTASGTVDARKNSSIINSMDKQAVSILYTIISNMFKVKVDEAHRLASMLNGILISRSADAKLQYSPRSVGDSDYPDVQEETEEKWHTF